MKKLVALPLVALIALACSEPTNPSSAVDLNPAYAKKSPLPAPGQPSVCPSGSSCATFEGIGPSADEIGITGASATTSPNSQQHYLGVKSAGNTYVMSQPAGGALTLTFNLYIIGNWLGDQKKSPDHAWQLAATCGTGAETLLVNATFSNRLGNAQSFPYDVSAKQHNGGLFAATGKDQLGFRSTNISFPGGEFDAADATYAIQRTIGACADTRTITFRGKDIGLEQMWGIDNVSLQ